MPAPWRRRARAPAKSATTVRRRSITGSHIIVPHEIINLGHDRTSLANMGRQAREATGTAKLTVLADPGYFSGPEVLACEAAGIVPILPKPLTSGAKANGHWGKQGFVCDPANDSYRCPAGETMIKRFSSMEHGITPHGYATPACRSHCTVKANAPPAPNAGSA